MPHDMKPDLSLHKENNKYSIYGFKMQVDAVDSFELALWKSTLPHWNWNDPVPTAFRVGLHNAFAQVQLHSNDFPAELRAFELSWSLRLHREKTL